MLLKTLREEVLEANLELVRRGLVLYTFGNASGISRKDGLIAIKPSGVPYETMSPEHMVITDLDGEIVEGDLRPSSDLADPPGNLPAFSQRWRRRSHALGIRDGLGAGAHGRSPALERPMPTTSTDEVPVTPPLTAEEIASDYEKNTGMAICRRFAKLDPDAVPAVLVAGHGPFCWGPNAAAAAHNAVILESVARMAYTRVTIASDAEPIPRESARQTFFSQARRKRLLRPGKPK